MLLKHYLLMLLFPSDKEEAPLDRSREGSPVADSTNQTTWVLRKWEDQRNETLGLTTLQTGDSPPSR